MPLRRLFALCLLGILCADGHADPGSPGLDSAALQRACDGGSIPDCSRLADWYRDPTHPGSQNFARARQLYEKVCQANKFIGAACIHLIAMYLDGIGGERSPQRALPILTDACNRSDARSCEYLGLVFVEGLAVPGIPYSYAAWHTGAGYYDKACKLGSGNACWHLGSLYGAGFGVDKSEKTARRLYDQACKLGQAQGCAELAKKP